MARRPTVSVITCTYNRPDYLPVAVRSVLDQDFADWELLVVNDGGRDVGGVVERFGDRRIRYFRRGRNRGKAACLNFALRRARGEYVAYLDDDDRWYPGHLSALTDALERCPDAGAAYSDLYEVTIVKDERGRRYPLQKTIRVCRDFSRSFMFYFNHVLHVSVMHRRELVLRAGGYDEDVRVLIDWDMNRKLCFLTDFVHVPAVTGEYFVQQAGSDRISDVQRRDPDAYRHTVRRIRADSPPGPWPKVRRVAIVFPVERWSQDEVDMLAYFADSLDYPCRLVLVDRRGAGPARRKKAAGRLLDLPNVTLVDGFFASERDAYQAGARAAEADLYYLPTVGASTELEHRLMRGVHYMEDHGARAVRWAVDSERPGPWDVLVERDLLFDGGLIGRADRPRATATVPPDWLPDQLESDKYLHAARGLLKEGDCRGASAVLDRVADAEKGAVGTPYLMQLYAEADFRLERWDRAERMCRALIERGYGADNRVRLGEIHRRRGRPADAIPCYRTGLKELGLTERDLDSGAFPIRTSGECQAFVILAGLGECCLALGRDADAARYLRMASRLRSNSARPHLAFGRLLLGRGAFHRAEQAFQMARQRADGRELAPAEVGLARIRRRNGEMDRAWDHCRAAMQAAPDAPEWLEPACTIARAVGREDEFLAACERYLEHRPGDVRALSLAARTHLEHGSRERGRELAEKVALLAPGTDTSELAPDPDSLRRAE